MKILCVCLGNICRSPTAEGVLKHMLEDLNLSSNVCVDSAGTSAWHRGEAPDGRSVHHAALRGYSLKGASRQVGGSDYEDFDFVLAMDRQNLFDLKADCKDKVLSSKIKLITDYCKVHTKDSVAQGVPDPYRSGEEGFELVLDILEDACHEFIKKEILKNKN